MTGIHSPHSPPSLSAYQDLQDRCSKDSHEKRTIHGGALKLRSESRPRKKAIGKNNFPAASLAAANAIVAPSPVLSKKLSFMHKSFSLCCLGAPQIATSRWQPGRTFCSLFVAPFGRF
eukprot:6179771-Pleurochrysis_carterae.AAC.1